MHIYNVNKTSHLCLLQPLYGFTSSDYIPFRNASGGGRDLHFADDKEIDLDDITLKALPKLPLQTSLKGEVCFFLLKYEELIDYNN